MSRRYLLGILVYNGQSVVPQCLRSAAQLNSDHVTVMVFDDCSPNPGWSDEVAEMCLRLGCGYYRTPRNLGIPRNMSLAMRTAVAGNYDIIGLVNSDVVMPANFIESMDAIFDSNESIASVTPWSNNVSAFSLPVGVASPITADAGFVSQLSAALTSINRGKVLPIPTGVGYCMMIPTSAVQQIGTMDPIFGRGYCEEVDWCQRARLLGFENVLALGAYVFHEGSGTNRDEGLLAHGMTTVPDHELIVRGRYPDYMDRVVQFFADGAFAATAADAWSQALRIVIADSGYDLVVGDPSTSVGATDRSVTVSAHENSDAARLSLHGMSAFLDLESLTEPSTVINQFGMPNRVRIMEPGRRGELYSQWALSKSIEVVSRVGYPGRA